ncbi:MAG: helix-turn-helix domain-containing protein [Candidatus Rokubacteria bacterium]|nr:helix-turn-helix domain-containing protein [Candidatus Rokubacteria bacterium]
MDTLLSLKTVAERTETSVALWRKLIARREIACARIGRSVRIRQSDLERFIGNRERPAR